MKINKSQVFVVELSFEELVAIVKLIGPTTPRQRLSEYGMTKEQDEAAEKLYDQISKYLEID